MLDTQYINNGVNSPAESGLTISTITNEMIPIKYFFFKIPNMKGAFLRGMASGSIRDPDSGSRTFSGTGGATGDNIGSYQADEFASHKHDTTASIDGSVGSPYTFQAYGDTGVNAISVGYSGGSETRPKNIYCIYIIKY